MLKKIALHSFRMNKYDKLLVLVYVFLITKYGKKTLNFICDAGYVGYHIILHELFQKQNLINQFATIMTDKF